MLPEDLFQQPEKDKVESPLQSLETDLILYSDSLKEVALEIVEGLSKYPIFVAHQHEVNIGEPVIEKDEAATEWNIHASTMEEFNQRGIIKDDRIPYFKQNYKDPSKFICVFVIVPEGANFVFYPYK